MRRVFVFALLLSLCHDPCVLAKDRFEPSRTPVHRSYLGVIQSIRTGAQNDDLFMKITLDHEPAVEILISKKHTKFEKMIHGKPVRAAQSDLSSGSRVEVNGAQIVRVHHFLNSWTNVYMPSSFTASGSAVFKPTVSVRVIKESPKLKKISRL